MKRFLLIIMSVFVANVALNAQNVAFINTETILNSMPSYTAAQSELNTLAEQYKASIQKEVDELDAIFKEYQQNRAYYNQQSQVEIENYILDKEKAINEKQESYFGEEGVMALKSEAALTPIKIKVQAAIDAVAAKHDCILVLDASVLAGVVYKNDKFDLTNEVIEYLK